MYDYEPKERGLGKISFGICREACTLLTAGAVVAESLCPTQAGAADKMHLERFLWCLVWSGDYFVPLGEMGEMGGGMAPGARAGPPQSGNFYHRCTQYNLSPIHHPISKPTPPPPPSPPHHPPSTIHPPPTGRPPQCSSECTRCLGAAV